MTLHESMAIVLRGAGWTTLDELAEELAERELYLRPKDGQPPAAYLGMRARQYLHWFEARGPGGKQIRLVPGGPGESVASDPPASGRNTAPAGGGDAATAARQVATREGRASSRPRTREAEAASSDPGAQMVKMKKGDADAARRRRTAAARKYQPSHVKLLLIAEAPPAAPDRYFYFGDVPKHDALFRYVARSILDVEPTRQNKPALLAGLRDAGVFLIDVQTDPLDGTALTVSVPGLVKRRSRSLPAR